MPSSRLPEYPDLRQVFSKSEAISLLPHRPYDCAIDLLPGTTPPGTTPFALFLLLQGHVFFFVNKKNKSPRPCIDYRGLNEIMLKNRYLLSLMFTAFELLQDAHIFSKLDQINAHHLAWIREGDEWKTTFNTPTGHYKYLVVPFGLTNAPAVFQALINDVLRDFFNVFVFTYPTTS